MSAPGVARVRIAIGWWLDDVGYRLREVAVRVSGGNTPGPSPLTVGHLFEVGRMVGVPASELVEQMERNRPNSNT
jgi:hypothetical protein